MQHQFLPPPSPSPIKGFDSLYCTLPQGFLLFFVFFFFFIFFFGSQIGPDEHVCVCVCWRCVMEEILFQCGNGRHISSFSKQLFTTERDSYGNFVLRRSASLSDAASLFFFVVVVVNRKKKKDLLFYSVYASSSSFLSSSSYLVAYHAVFSPSSFSTNQHRSILCCTAL